MLHKERPNRHVWKQAGLSVWDRIRSNAKNTNIFDSQAAVIPKNKCNAVVKSEKVAHPCPRVHDVPHLTATTIVYVKLTLLKANRK